MLPEWLLAARDGAQAVLGQPLALLAALSVALATRGRIGHGSRLALGVFLAAAVAASTVPPSAMHAAAAAALLAVLGVAVATGWRWGRAVHVAAAALGGLALGLAAGLPVALPSEAGGSLLVGGALLALLLAVHRALERRWHRHVALRFGPRVLGAWVAAIGLLLMALQLWARPG